MEFPTFTALIAAAGLVAGFVLCWLFMRAHSVDPAPPDRLEMQGELAQAQSRIRQLEGERQMAVKNYEDLKHDTARAQGVANAVKKTTVPPAEHAAQVASLQAQLATLQEQEQAARTDAANAKAEALAEQTQAKDYFSLLEKNQQLAAAHAQALKLEADTLREALELAQKELAHTAQQVAQLSALQAQLAALSPPAQATQLPVLEEQVVALQNLEKTIKKEFQLLAEMQRNVTLTAATRHEFNDSLDAQTSSNASTAA